MINKENKERENFYYEKAAEKGGFNSGVRKQIVDFIIGELPKGNRLLAEIGCGDGLLPKSLPDSVKYTGVDAFPFAIERAKEFHKNNDNVNFLVGDSDNLPFGSNNFDFVASIFSLEHFSKPKESLDEMARILRPGGHLIILAPNLEMPFSLPNAIRHKNIFYKIWFVVLKFKDYALRLFGKYNFTVIGENFTEATKKYEKADDDLKYLVSSFEVINYLGKEREMSVVFENRIRKAVGLKSKIKKLISFLPAMKYYGTELFIIAQKNQNHA